MASIGTMSNDAPQWQAVDSYLIDTLVHEDDILVAARASSAETTTPHIEVAPNQGALLSVIAQASGATRVLEFGTLAGYSGIWFARAVGPEGRVVTLELEEDNARIARENFARAGVADRVEVVVGPALESANALIAAGEESFDVVFIDADKPNNANYLEAALKLSHPGTVIIVDNVVRHGALADSESSDPRVRGSREVIDRIGADPRLAATALQTVGVKGWDGFAIAVVR